MEKTLLVIKPDAVEAKKIGEIISILEKNGFRILDIRMKKFTEKEAQGFYSPHKGKDFYKKLVKFITKGKIVGILLEKENAIFALRKLVGATNPEIAEKKTIRKLFGKNITENAVHASDSERSFKREITYFFRT